MMREVRKERTDWRDSKLDKIHNLFGYECPCENVEFLMIEYDQGTPVALVDYRLKGRVNSEPSKSVIELCKNRNFEIPFIVVNYEILNKQMTNIDILCCNSSAINVIGNKTGITEKDYVKIMYSIREKIVPGRTQQGVALANSLSNTLPDATENWEGEILSHRHRDWGWDCPVVDIDFIVVNNGKPVAIVEYKNRQSFSSPSKFKFHPTGKTLSFLSDTAIPKIPLLFVYYNDRFTEFRIYPVTRGWDKYDDYFGVDLNREEYFNFLKTL